MSFKAKTAASKPLKNQLPRTFVLLNGKGSRKTAMKCISEIVDDREGNEGNTTTIQYVRNETSIYRDKQRQDADKKIETIYLEKDTITIQPTERNLLMFIEKCEYNVDSKNFKGTSKFRLQEFNPNKMAKESVEKEMAAAEAIMLIKTLRATTEGINELITYAEVIGIDTENSPEIVIYKLMEFAKSAPQDFLDGFKSSTMKNKWWVLKAIKLKYIVVNEGSKSVTSSSGATLYTAPAETLISDIVDEFVMWCDGKEGQQIFAALRKFVESKL